MSALSLSTSEPQPVEAAIEVDRVSASYRVWLEGASGITGIRNMVRRDNSGKREVPALRDVSLVLPAGSVVALVGENGAGKTTLVKLLAKLYEPDAGEIAVDGVQASTRYPGKVALRFARVRRYRDDKPASEADTIEQVQALLR